MRYGLVRPLAHASSLSEVPTQGEVVPALAADLAPAKPDSYVLIKYEDFEGVWPNSGWSVTGCENHPCWDNDNYRPFAGSWAAWPARAGAGGYDPELGNDNYLNNQGTRMIYGPFSLAGAIQGNVDAHLHPHPHPHSNSHPNPHAHVHAHAHHHPHPYAHTGDYVYAHANPNLYSHPFTDSNMDANHYTNSHTHSNASVIQSETQNRDPSGDSR